MQFDARGVTPLVGEEIRQTMRCGGSDIGVTTHYLTKDGRAWLPVMGELHYSRILQKDWEKELLKMKDGGVEIISSYVFWLHHETEPGKFNWEGNYSLRAFIQLCEKHSLYFFLGRGLGHMANAEMAVSRIGWIWLVTVSCAAWIKFIWDM